MSYHEMSEATATECSQLAFDYHPDCYCAFHYIRVDYPPRAKYRYLGPKYLQVCVWRTVPDQSDRCVAVVVGDTGPELLRQLRYVFACLRAGTLPDPSLVPPPTPMRLLPMSPGGIA